MRFALTRALIHSLFFFLARLRVPSQTQPTHSCLHLSVIGPVRLCVQATMVGHSQVVPQVVAFPGGAHSRKVADSQGLSILLGDVVTGNAAYQGSVGTDAAAQVRWVFASSYSHDHFTERLDLAIAVNLAGFQPLSVAWHVVTSKPNARDLTSWSKNLSSKTSKVSRLCCSSLILQVEISVPLAYFIAGSHIEPMDCLLFNQ